MVPDPSPKRSTLGSPLTIVHIYDSRHLQLDENGTAVSMDRRCAVSGLSFDPCHPEQTLFDPS